MTDELGKAESSTALVPHGDKAIVKRSKPTLMTFGNRIVPSDGRWHADLCAQYVVDHGRTKWVPMGELARSFFAGNTPSNKQKVRRRLFQVARVLLDQALLLVVEFDPKTGAALACKIYDARSEQERQWVRARLERMEHMKMLKTDQFDRAVALAENMDAVR